MLNFYDPAKTETMDAIIEKHTARNAATIESLRAASLNRKQDDSDAKLNVRCGTVSLCGMDWLDDGFLYTESTH